MDEALNGANTVLAWQNLQFHNSESSERQEGSSEETEFVKRVQTGSILSKTQPRRRALLLGELLCTPANLEPTAQAQRPTAAALCFARPTQLTKVSDSLSQHALGPTSDAPALGLLGSVVFTAPHATKVPAAKLQFPGSRARAVLIEFAVGTTVGTRGREWRWQGCWSPGGALE